MKRIQMLRIFFREISALWEKPYLKISMVPLLFGIAIVSGRVIAMEIPPFTAAFLRFSFAAVSLILIVVKRNGRIPLPELRQLVVLLMVSITGVVLFNYCLFSGLKTITASRAAVILALIPTVVTLFSVILFKEQASFLLIFGVIFAFAGAVIVITGGRAAQIVKQGINSGDLFILGGVLCWATYTLLGKAAMKDVSALLAITYSCIFGALLLFIPAYLETRFLSLFDYSLKAWLNLLNMGVVGVAFAHVLYYEGVKDLGNSKAAIFINLESVSAIFFGVIFLGEEITLPFAIGTLLVLIGVFLTSRSGGDNRLVNSP
ncbi:MAG: EamA/RhaT family transporter [Spirochaetes bacterium]|nr:MAG: EamA/RhaT family transporter [Spirochaetota bacterium]